MAFSFKDRVKETYPTAMAVFNPGIQSYMIVDPGFAVEKLTYEQWLNVYLDNDASALYISLRYKKTEDLAWEDAYEDIQHLMIMRLER